MPTVRRGKRNEAASFPPDSEMDRAAPTASTRSTGESLPAEYEAALTSLNAAKLELLVRSAARAEAVFDVNSH